jgi:hypothetical protein
LPPRRVGPYCDRPFQGWPFSSEHSFAHDKADKVTLVDVGIDIENNISALWKIPLVENYPEMAVLIWN